MVQPYKPIYTVKEVAELLCTNRNVIYDFQNRGRLPYLLINGSRKVRGTDLENFINKYPVEATGKEQPCEQQEISQSQ